MKPASFWDWLGPFILMAVFIAYLFLSTPSEVVLCRGEGNCFREWVGAMSGWAAAAAAALTIGVLVRQVQAQQAQTDFTLGDAEPTFDAVQHVRSDSKVVIRIVNWNRRSLVLREIEFLHPFNMIAVLSLNGNQRDYAAPKLELSPVRIVEGWLNQNNAPPTDELRFVALFGRPNTDDTYIGINSEWDQATVSFRYELVGTPGTRTMTIPVHRTVGEPEVYLVQE